MATTAAPRTSRRSTVGAIRVVLPLVGHAVRAQLRLVTAVAALMVGMGLLVGSLWPSLQDTLAEMQAALPDAFATILAGADMSTASGWANAEMMSMVAPAGVIVVAVVSATKATAGEEQDKTLGLLLGAPVTRSAFLVAKTVAMVVHALLVAGAVGVGLALGSVVGDMGLSLPGVAAVALHTWLLGVVFGAVAIAVGAGTGDRRVTLAVAAGLAVAAFAVASFLPLSSSLADGVRVSPWYYFNSSDPLAHGADIAHLTVLLVTAVVVAAVGVLRFRRRDLRG
ncbi:MAG: ABC transporter permease subunit [Nocardioidaceae bacterium]